MNFENFVENVKNTENPIIKTFLFVFGIVFYILMSIVDLLLSILEIFLPLIINPILCFFKKRIKYENIEEKYEDLL